LAGWGDGGKRGAAQTAGKLSTHAAHGQNLKPESLEELQ
jgi:hypothetical protein